LIPADIRAGAMMKPPPAPMQPVMRPAQSPMRIEATKDVGQYVARGSGLIHHLRRHRRSKDEDRDHEQDQDQQSFGVVDDPVRGLQLPLGVGARRNHHELSPGLEKAHDISPSSMRT